jgi:hypothetical protein
MIFINGEFISTDGAIGPWITDQEIKAMVRKSADHDLSTQYLTELRTVCREFLAEGSAIYREPFTTQ